MHAGSKFSSGSTPPYKQQQSPEDEWRGWFLLHGCLRVRSGGDFGAPGAFLTTRRVVETSLTDSPPRSASLALKKTSRLLPSPMRKTACRRYEVRHEPIPVWRSGGQSTNTVTTAAGGNCSIRLHPEPGISLGCFACMLNGSLLGAPTEHTSPVNEFATCSKPPNAAIAVRHQITVVRMTR